MKTLDLLPIGDHSGLGALMPSFALNADATGGGPGAPLKPSFSLSGSATGDGPGAPLKPVFGLSGNATGGGGPLLENLARALADSFRVPCRILDARLDPRLAFHPERGQYHSSELLRAMQPYVANGAWRVLGVTSVDLYIPILTFVFGEAQLGGPCAIVSFHRLQQEFYGLPGDAGLLADRLIKESVHEVGHTFDLTHCNDYSCAMAPSHAVEWIDLKQSAFCPSCRARALEAVG